MLRHLLCLVIACAALPAAAQEEGGPFRLGGDVFEAGSTVVLSEDGVDDAFLAGETVEIDAALQGSAYLAGRRVRVDAPVGGPLHAMGQSIDVSAAIGGDAALAAQRIDVAAPVAGDLRAFASEMDLRGPVGGTLFATGEYVTLDGVVTGDAAIAARVLEFGPGARIEGRLVLFEDRFEDDFAVPERVIPAERIERRKHGKLDQDVTEAIDFSPVSRRAVLTGFLTSVLFVTVLAALFAALAPQTMAGLRRRVLGAPGRSLLTGFVAFSTLIGATVVLGLTVIGLLVAPIAVILALAGAYAGYIVAAYALGAGLMMAAGRGEPDTTLDRVVAAVVGALVAGAVGLIPFLGWIAVLGFVMLGLGAIAGRLLRPALFVGDA